MTDAPQSLLKTNILVATGTLLCRITGFLRVLTLAYVFGLTGLSDVYNTANTTPNIIYELMLGGILSATLLPIMVRAIKDDDHDAISAVLSVTGLCLLALTSLMVLASPLIMSLYSQARLDEPALFHRTGTILVAYFLPQIFFYGTISLATAVLNAHQKFALPAYAPVLNNVIVIGVLLGAGFLYPNTLTLNEASQNPAFLALLGLGTTAGIACSSLILVPAVLRSGLRLRFLPDWKHPALRQVLRLSGWTLGYVIANQAALFMITRLALSEEGWLSAYQTAFTFFLLPHGLLAVSIMTTFSPSLARAAAENQIDLLKEKLSHGLRLLALLMIPASVGLMLIAEPLVTALLEHGRFNAASSSLTAQTLAMFALGLFPFSAYLFLLRGFYAQQDTRTPFWINALENILNVALAFPLMQIYGVAGLALSYALAYTIAALVTAGMLEKTLKGLPWTMFLNSLWRIAGATLVMGAAIGIVSVFLTTAPPLVKTLAMVLVGGIGYAGSVIAFRTPEALSFLRPFLRKG